MNNTTKHNKNNLILFIFVLIGLVIIFSYGIDNVSATSGDTIYVSAYGNDSWNGQNATYQSGLSGPKLSINNAIGTVNKGGTVKIENGFYKGANNTNININKNISIIGQNKDGTKINGTDDNWIFTINNGVNAIITNLTLTNGKTTSGGAIYNIGSLTLNNIIFTSNSATMWGGAIWNDGTMTITNSSFTNNTATNNGGGIYNTGVLTVTNSNFTNNKANTSGGAIWNDDILSLKNSNFTNNNGGWGGAIFNYGTTSIASSNFTSNHVTQDDGGAIYNDNHGNINITKSNFINNNATNGGAIYNYAFNYGGNLTVMNTNFNINHATNGGAIYNLGILTAMSNNFNGNRATNGGAIYNYASASVEFNRIIENIGSTGSAIYNNQGIIDASLNWWGDNKGPCGEINGLTVNKWLVLTINAIPNKQYNTYLNITADLKHDNKGAYYSGEYIPNGLPVYFSTTLGNLNKQSVILNGISQTIFKSSSAGIATISAKTDNQTVQNLVKVLNIIPPKVISTNPKNYQTGFSKTGTIAIKFNQNIKTSANWSNIYIKNLTTGKIVSINKWISGNTLCIKMTLTRRAYNWYQVIIPKSAINNNNNNLGDTYQFKFKTGS